MKRILIITYYWPPSGGISTQRWLKFANYLRENNIEPVIYTAKNANYPIVDENLLKLVPENITTYRTKVIEPNNLISIFKSKKNKNKAIHKLQQQENVKTSFVKKTLWSIRGNYFIPDARFLWIKPSVKFIEKILEKEKIELIISTGPPHSVHMIASKIKEKTGLPWISDFRDPWTSMDYLQEMSLSHKALKKHQDFEKKVLTQSDEVIVVGNTIHNEFKENYNISSHIISNGFDNKREINSDKTFDEKFTIVHVGSFLSNRNCDDLWQVLQEFSQNNPEFKAKLEIKLIGKVAPNILESIEKYELTPFLNKIEQVNHEKAISFQQSAQVLLLPIDRIENAEFVVTGKLFEYLMSKRPILLLAPKDGDAARIIMDTKAGYCCNFDNLVEIRVALEELFKKYQTGNNTSESIGINKYSVKELTKQLASLINHTIEKSNK